MGARQTPPTVPGLMPLAGHLVEARKRIFRASIGLAVAVVVGYLLADPILDVLRAPIVALAEIIEKTQRQSTSRRANGVVGFS